MTTPLLWLTPEDMNDYPQAFRAGRFNRMSLSERVGGNPGPDHPMQYISAQVALFYAALCDCRLPTPAEWQAAYATYEQTVPMEKWNLRDQTWETQRRYAETAGSEHWPDEGIFSVGRIAWAVGRSATSRTDNDGALYFQPVTGSGAAVFHHLVGNVAEFVCDAPREFDLAPNKTTAAGIRGFVEQQPKSLYVIGGSALSPPEVPFDKPQPVAQSDEAYTDVGLRLAFTAPSRSLAEKIKWVVGSPPFIWAGAKVAGK
jgi:formylglycine-generating enzyme required for sulfatase activity